MPKILTLLRFVVLTVMSCSVAACGTPKPIPPGTNTYYYGYIKTGGKFGVLIGQNREAAKGGLLDNGAEFGGVIDCGHERLKETIDCSSIDEVDVYILFWKFPTFREGQVYVFIEDDKVAAIAWSLRLLPEIVF